MAPSTPTTPTGEGTIEASLQSAIETKTINGAIILATDSTGSFTYNKAFGTRTLLSGEKVPQKLNDILYLASATKLIASIAALQCVEDGLISLTGDLSSIVPELTDKKILTGWSEDGETPILEDQVRPVTLEMLLTHSSGAVYDFMDPAGLGKWNAKFNPPQEGVKRNVEVAFSYPLSFQPGSSWMYGGGLDWAGWIVERVTGRRLGDHIRERIIGAVGGNPNEAEFYPVKSEELRARVIDLNPDDPYGIGRAVLSGGGDMNMLSEGDFGGHGLFTTGENYLKIMKSLLTNGGKLLRKETVEDMFRDHLSEEAKEGHQAALTSPMGGFFAVGTEGIKVGHGLGGLLTLDDADGWYGDRTMSWGGGLTLVWFIDRKNDLCGIGALQAAFPLNPDKIVELKQIIRKDIYRKRSASREG